MAVPSKAKDPIVLSYLELRKAVGIVALGLPFVVAIPVWILQHIIESSISGYYYTGMRNPFVGCLCAISMFMLCCRGYDRKDEIAGTFSAVCSLGVAFFPTAPEQGATRQQEYVGIVHYTFAILLFSALTYFCLVLFKMTAENRKVTRKKAQRNLVYTVCGYVIIASVLLVALCKLFKVEHLVGNLGPTFCFETTALIAFGAAWLIKGETILKDEAMAPTSTATNGKAGEEAASLSDGEVQAFWGLSCPACSSQSDKSRERNWAEAEADITSPLTSTKYQSDSNVTRHWDSP
jgi:hypothetical protein